MMEDITSLYDLTYNHKVSDFLGVKIHWHKTKETTNVTPKELITSIFNDLEWKKPNSKLQSFNLWLYMQIQKPSTLNETWSNTAVTGKTNHSEILARPDSAYAVHQSARFMESPKKEHSADVKSVGSYLKKSQDKDTVLTPTNEGLYWFVNVDFSGIDINQWEHHIQLQLHLEPAIS
jgi:hypothetical protein